MVANAVIDGLDRDPPMASTGSEWQVLTDRVMGGVSRGTLTREMIAGRPALRLRGEVSLENNGGFIQMALDLAPGGESVDAGLWTGIEFDVFGEDQEYGVHLRTPDLIRPWQSYRHGFRTLPVWQSLRMPFAGFALHRTDAPLDTTRLRRLGVVAIGRAFSADLALGGVRFFA